MIKRLFDLLFASLGLMMLAPLFACIALIIKLDSNGPIFFRQVRVGQFNKNFKIYKFRTMCTNAERIGALVSTGDDPRITKVGSFLRRYKLDELPQLLNVVKGEMSLVGPRPEVSRYVDKFSKDYAEILKIKPGITDFAALEYRDENELLNGVEDPDKIYVEKILPDKIVYYRRYIEEMGFFTDILILYKTMIAIFK